MAEEHDKLGFVFLYPRGIVRIIAFCSTSQNIMPIIDAFVDFRCDAAGRIFQ